MQDKSKHKTLLLVLMLKHSRSFIYHLLCTENKAEKIKKKKQNKIFLLLFILVLYFQSKIREQIKQTNIPG